MPMLGPFQKMPWCVLPMDSRKCFASRPKVSDADWDVTRREAWCGVAVTVGFQLPDGGNQF